MEKEEVLNEEVEEFIKDDVKKSVTQKDKIDPSVNEHISEMGWLFDASRRKIQADKTCYGCKREVILGKEKLYLVEAGKTEKGVFAILSLCEKCYSKLQEEAKKKKEAITKETDKVKNEEVK